MKAYYCDHFVLPLPENHRFPMQKYALLRKAIIESGTISLSHLLVPDAATDEQILRVHDANYLNKVKHGALSDKEIRKLGFPWSPELVERSRRSVGGTISACRSAITDGIAVNLAGGTHHAFVEHGAGFCVLNDAAIAARNMQYEGHAQQIVILDCDVHQGEAPPQSSRMIPLCLLFLFTEIAITHFGNSKATLTLHSMMALATMST